MRSQTSTEYLIVLGIVIVIAVLVVGILGGIPGLGGGPSDSATRILLKTQSIGIDNYAILEGGFAQLEVVNNQNTVATLDNISINGIECIVPNAPVKLRPGQKKNIEVGCKNLALTAEEDFDFDLSVVWSDDKTSATYTQSDQDASLIGSGAQLGVCERFKYSISTGHTHTCAVVANGSVECWGKGSYGKIGYGGYSDQLSPRLVSGITNAIQVDVGDWHSCALLDTGSVQCWGSGSVGRLGHGSSPSSQSTPVTVSNINSANKIALGQSFSCALLTNGSVQCWGANNIGQLGNGGIPSISTTPVLVSNLSNAIDIDSGENHACAVLSDGTIKCWGLGSSGQLGHGSSPAAQYTPVVVRHISSATTVGLTDSTSCALLRNGSLQCWGSNSQGELGNGNAPTSSNTPVNVSNLNSVLHLRGGRQSNCAITRSGQVYCWGPNTYNHLGAGSTSYEVPTRVLTNALYVDIQSGNSHFCGITNQGFAYCMGRAFDGRLGTGNLTNQDNPTLVDMMQIGQTGYGTCY